ncbi:MAG: SGNH/GDSL hydrolase family protein, partial [Bacteroidota bacterium]|nr:SGNH/GDSL hydrolase family protein [Bacteroidota bacterium]
SDEIKALHTKRQCLQPNPAIVTAPIEIEVSEVIPSSRSFHDPLITESTTSQPDLSSTVVHPTDNELIQPEKHGESETIASPATEEPVQLQSAQPEGSVSIQTANNEPTTMPSSKQNHPKTQNHILIVADSNGKHIDPELIHNQKTVTIEKKYYLDHAIKVPGHVEPLKVSDVVMLTGINDLKYIDIPVVIGKVDNACREYQRKFPNAKIHIGSIASANLKCIQYNAHLYDLAAERGVPFISNHEMFDAKTGEVKPGMIEKNDIHYTRKGIIPLATEIKRSLYGYNKAQSRPRPNTRQSHPINHQNHNQDRQNPLPHPQFIQPNQVFALRNLFNMALSYLPNH